MPAKEQWVSKMWRKGLCAQPVDIGEHRRMHFTKTSTAKTTHIADNSGELGQAKIANSTAAAAASMERLKQSVADARVEAPAVHSNAQDILAALRTAGVNLPTTTPGDAAEDDKNKNG